MNICEPPRLTMGGKILLRLDPLEYNRWNRVIYPFPSSLKMPQKTFFDFLILSNPLSLLHPLLFFSLPPFTKRTLYITPLRVYMYKLCTRRPLCHLVVMSLLGHRVLNSIFKNKVKCVHNNKINPYTRISQIVKKNWL